MEGIIPCCEYNFFFKNAHSLNKLSSKYSEHIFINKSLFCHISAKLHCETKEIVIIWGGERVKDELNQNLLRILYSCVWIFEGGLVLSKSLNPNAKIKTLC